MWKPVLLLLAGCGYPSGAYLADAADVSCDIVLACTDWYDAPDRCLAATERVDVAGCRYDARAARQCISELRRSTCPGDGTLPPEPDACARVWSGCDVAASR